MTEADLDTIESELSLQLPEAYRKAVCPFPVRAYIGNDDTDLWDDPAKLIELNHRLHDKERWPANLFAVGCEPSGAMSAIDLSSPEAEMWWIDRDIRAPGTSAIGQSFSDWADELLESMRSGEHRDGFDPVNDPPGTREQYEPIRLIHIFGCVGVIVAIAVLGALVIFGFQVLFGFA